MFIARHFLRAIDYKELSQTYKPKLYLSTSFVVGNELQCIFFIFSKGRTAYGKFNDYTAPMS